MELTKKAVIRDPAAPMFAPADMWVECCGGKLPLQRVMNSRIVLAYPEARCPVCMALYDARGYVLVPGGAS
jgi:hypothetical protein